MLFPIINDHNFNLSILHIGKMSWFDNIWRGSGEEANGSQSQSDTFFRSYSTSRSCYTDPQDNQYMICK